MHGHVVFYISCVSVSIFLVALLDVVRLTYSRDVHCGMNNFNKPIVRVSTGGARTAYLPGAHDFTPGFQ